MKLQSKSLWLREIKSLIRTMKLKSRTINLRKTKRSFWEKTRLLKTISRASMEVLFRKLQCLEIKLKIGSLVSKDLNLALKQTKQTEALLDFHQEEAVLVKRKMHYSQAEKRNLKFKNTSATILKNIKQNQKRPTMKCKHKRLKEITLPQISWSCIHSLKT